MSHATVIGSLQQIGRQLGGQGHVPAAAFTDPREDLLVLYSTCEGVFHVTPTGPIITIKGTLYSLDRQEVGTWEGVDEAVPPLLPFAFLEPTPPPGPFDTPDNTVVPKVQVLSWSKGIWRFHDGSSITAVGPAQLRAVYWNTHQGQLWVSGNQMVTGGTGRYAGVQGVKTVSGSAWVAPENGQDPNMTQPGVFPARVIDVFRLVRAENIGGPPPLS